MQEKTLFEEIRNGNIEMFGILFKKYFGSMCVIAKSFISDTQAAEDIVQDIFIRLWEKRREYEEIPNLQVFLYVLVKNRCMDISSRNFPRPCPRRRNLPYYRRCHSSTSCPKC